ncbi:membrane protein insertion efficiency factor YidD [Nocardia jiangxiensis]|uniref:Putative membrane protein insertion efficiency factor n=1 Tax=Nocardia jiangxiensis TaxID=282685 RepID=A0ABW6RWE3_9NOCA|nr:membrane protein insertion efficiency factor YidD [Nocardia jiangxiensis]
MNRLRTLAALPAKLLIFLIELYRTYVSPTRMPVCRFTPTCSEYAVTALRTRGLFIGLGLTAVRLAKCAPWHPGGWDPVPERKRKGAAADPASPESSATEPSPATDAAAEHEPLKESPRAVTGDTTDGST